MIHLQITKWVQKDNNPNIWWRGVEELYDVLVDSNEEQVQKIFNYIESALAFQSDISNIVAFYHKQKSSDNNVYSCVAFDSLDKFQEFNLVKNTQSFLDYSQRRTELLTLWNIEMTVSQLISLDTSIEEISQPNFLMNKFNELT